MRNRRKTATSVRLYLSWPLLSFSHPRHLVLPIYGLEATHTTTQPMSHPRIVPCGGWCFVAFLDLCAAPTVHRLWRTALAEATRNDTTIREEDYDMLVDSAACLYLGFVLQTVVQLHSKARKQRFHNTFVARYHGLSKMGCNLLSSYGILLPSSSYDRMRVKAVNEADMECAYTHLPLRTCPEHA